MKVKVALALIFAFAMSVGPGCSYGGVATVDEDTVVITKNTVFGVMRQVYVCEVTDDGVQNCSEQSQP